MKKALFCLLTFPFVLFVACAPSGNNNANSNSTLVTGATYTVGINLAIKPGKDTYYFEVAPEEVHVKAGADQVQWVVTNFTDLALSDVTIDNFRGRETGNTDPFKNGSKFILSKLSARSADGGLKTGTSAIIDTFDYQISATLTLKDGRKVPVTLDPRIVVSGG